MICDENGDMWFCVECYSNGNAADEAHRNGLLLMGEDEDERYQECEACGNFYSSQERCGHDYCDECVLECCEECREIHAEDCKDDPEGLDRWNLRKTKFFSACIIQRAWRKYSLLQKPVESPSVKVSKVCCCFGLSPAEFASIKASDFRNQLVECGTVTYEQMELVSDEKLQEAIKSSGVLHNYSFTDVWENSTEVLFDVLEELDLPEDEEAACDRDGPEESESELDEDGYPYDRCDKCGEILPRDFDWITRPNGRCYDCVPECETNDDEDDVGCDTDAECNEP